MPLDRLLISIALLLFMATWMTKSVKPSWHKSFSVGSWFFLSLLIIRFFFWELARTEGPSMLPTIPDQSVVFVDRQAYGFPSPIGKAHPWSTVAPRDDIVAFSVNSSMWIKRVRARSGDVLTLKYPDGWYINGYYAAPLSPKTLNWLSHAGFSFSGYEAARASSQVDILSQWKEKKSFNINVPYGFLFVVGDNPSSSFDSRDFGFVPMDRVVGRVDVIKKGNSGET